MIKGEQNYIYTLQADHTLAGMEFKKGQEFNIINEVVYMQGYPLPLNLQPTVLNWIRNNGKLFVIMNREY